ncbi:hypothetical protein ZOSMA_174G00130 [Zostera marina]|uniref:Serine-threonine/tyrosine-protein kinase catalytic domain-containing protein n=1 Tax=Zostera marina TaxID=29655 RepID=A0A0K9PU90_ZOSMR|nr:hypothetical protein ZOSMA_174G00130 [Zostera marina]
MWLNCYFSIEIFLKEFEIEEPLAIDFGVLEIATNSFSNDNRMGDIFDRVYKGVLKNNQEIAVEIFKSSDTNSKFEHLVSLIGKFKHKNTVRLIGYSITDMHKLIVSEYIPPNNNTLSYFLFGTQFSLVSSNSYMLYILIIHIQVSIYILLV